jgi:hypothetical protein
VQLLITARRSVVLPTVARRLARSYFVRADKDGFEAVAIGTGPSLGGDLWRIGNRGEIEHLIDGCR